MDVPDIEIHHLETRVEGVESGHRGVGESGNIGAPVALVNAIEDALAPFDVTITESYLPPQRILELARQI